MPYHARPIFWVLCGILGLHRAGAQAAISPAESAALELKLPTPASAAPAQRGLLKRTLKNPTVPAPGDAAPRAIPQDACSHRAVAVALSDDASISAPPSTPAQQQAMQPVLSPDASPPPPLTPAEQDLLQRALVNDASVASLSPGASGTLSPPLRVWQSMNPDIAAILDVALAVFNTETPMQLGGHDPRAPGFNLQQFEVHMSANVDPFVRLDTNLVYTASGVEIEEAFATSLALPGNLQVRAGQFLTRFGRINPTHPHTWHFVDQPLVLGKFFGGDGNRGLGAEVSWLSFLPWYLELVVSANRADDDCCNRSYWGDNPAPMAHVSDALWTGALKQFFALADDWSLMWGLSAQTAPNAQGGRTAIYGSDVYLRYRPVSGGTRSYVSLQIEGMMRDRTGGPRTERDAGGYAEAIWGIDPNWELGARGELVTAVAHDSLDPKWNQRRTRYAGQLTYYPSHFSRLRLQATMDRPDWLDKPIYGAFLALEVAVGAHGAHPY